MHRRVTTVALATTLAAVLAVSACSSKSTDSGSESSGSAGSGLAISPVAQINTAGEEQPAVQEANALNPAEPGGQTCAPATIAMAGALTERVTNARAPREVAEDKTGGAA